MNKFSNKEVVEFQIGKNGITDGSIEAIHGHLKNNKKVKVKFLKNFLGSTDRHSASEEVYRKISEKISVNNKLVGNVLFLKKKQKI